MPHFTKDALIQSFIKLLNEEPLDKITVKDIVEDCGVNRNTFYYYFSDIYALLEEIFWKETQSAIENQKNFDSWQDGFFHSVKFAVDNRKAVYHIYNSLSRKQLEGYLYNVTFTLMKDFVEHQSEGILAQEDDKDYIASFYTFALIGMFTDWISNGMKDPQLFVTKMSSLFEGTVKIALEKSTQNI
ncbi:MAG: TetR/AcrR family transcriptional regulator [Oscillospiraceae bacterium]